MSSSRKPAAATIATRRHLLPDNAGQQRLECQQRHENNARHDPGRGIEQDDGHTRQMKAVLTEDIGVERQRGST